MQITFDPTNPAELKWLAAALNAALPALPAHPQHQQELPLSAPAPVAQPAAAPTSVPTSVAQPDAPKRRGRPPKARPEGPAPAPTFVADVPQITMFDESEREPEPEPAPEPAPALTIDDVRSALQAFTSQRGVPAGVELLKQFKAGRISELDPARYSEFVLACEAA